MFSCVISHWYILKSLSFSRFQIPCFHLFVCILSTIHSFFIGTNENFHVSWSFNIITGTFRAFRLFVCVYAFAIIVVCWYLYSMSSFNVYHSVLSALRLGWLLTQPTHQTTPLYSLSTLTIAISQRRIVRKIYYAYKFPTSFVFSLANANGNLDGVFFFLPPSSFSSSSWNIIHLAFGQILSSNRQPLKMVIACGHICYSICTMYYVCSVSFFLQTNFIEFQRKKISSIKITETFINSQTVSAFFSGIFMTEPIVVAIARNNSVTACVQTVILNQLFVLERIRWL